MQVYFWPHVAVSSCSTLPDNQSACRMHLLLILRLNYPYRTAIILSIQLSWPSLWNLWILCCFASYRTVASHYPSTTNCFITGWNYPNKVIASRENCSKQDNFHGRRMPITHCYLWIIQFWHQHCFLIVYLLPCVMQFDCITWDQKWEYSVRVGNENRSDLLNR